MEHVSKLTWNQMSMPQNTIPVTFDGKPFVLESDEFLRTAATAPARPGSSTSPIRRTRS